MRYSLFCSWNFLCLLFLIILLHCNNFNCQINLEIAKFDVASMVIRYQSCNLAIISQNVHGIFENVSIKHFVTQQMVQEAVDPSFQVIHFKFYHALLRYRLTKTDLFTHNCETDTLIFEQKFNNLWCIFDMSLIGGRNIFCSIDIGRYTCSILTLSSLSATCVMQSLFYSLCYAVCYLQWLFIRMC